MKSNLNEWLNKTNRIKNQKYPCEIDEMQPHWQEKIQENKKFCLQKVKYATLLARKKVEWNENSTKQKILRSNDELCNLSCLNNKP